MCIYIYICLKSKLLYKIKKNNWFVSEKIMEGPGDGGGGFGNPSVYIGA